MAQFKVLLGDNLIPKEFNMRENLLKKAAEKNIDLEVVEATGNSEEELIRLGKGADVVVVMRNKFNRKVAEALKDTCKLAIKPAIGYEQIDAEACTDNGIMVANVPAYCTGEVADHTVALYLATVRYLVPRDRAIKDGGWRIPDPYIPRLSEISFGILGFGRIARAVAARIKPFVKEVIAYDPYLPDSVFADAGVKRAATVEEMLPVVEGLSINLPLTDETAGMINSKTLAMMKPTSIIVNTGRGPIIKEADLCDAIENGVILGAGLDVHEVEPLPADSRLRKLDRVILTAHQGSYSNQSIPQLGDEAMNDIIRCLQGEPLIGLVNGRELAARK